MTKMRTDRRPSRRMGAQTRAAQRLARTAQEQLELVKGRPGNAAREKARLEAQVPAPRKTAAKGKRAA